MHRGLRNTGSKHVGIKHVKSKYGQSYTITPNINAPTYLIHTDCIPMIFTPTTVTFTNVIQTRPPVLHHLKLFLLM